MADVTVEIGGERFDLTDKQLRQVAERVDGPAVLASNVGHGKLKSFIERIERLEEDKAAVGADLKEVFAEAKGEGFDTRIIRKVVRLRKQDGAKRAEEEALVALYVAAIGGL